MLNKCFLKKILLYAEVHLIDCVQNCGYVCILTHVKDLKDILSWWFSFQMDAQACAVGTGSASWCRTAGTASATPAGGALAAVLPWRSLAPTTKTMKEVRRSA